MATKKAAKKQAAKAPTGDAGVDETELEREIIVEDDEALIREKIQAGLSRKQAVEVIARQREHDAATNAAEGLSED